MMKDASYQIQTRFGISGSKMLKANENDLFKAIKLGNYSVLRDYLKNNGDITIRDEEDRNLLHILFMRNDYPPELALRLIKSGCALDNNAIPPNPEFNYFESFYFLDEPTILHCAYFACNLYKYDQNRNEDNKRVFEQLLNHPNIEVNATCDVSHSASIEDLEGDHMYHDALTRNEGECYLEQATVLHFAAAQGNFEAVKMILASRRADINSRANIIYNKDLVENMPYDPSYPPTVDLDLLDNPREYGEIGISLLNNMRDLATIYRVGPITPLYLAAKGNFRKIVTLLLNHGANLDISDNEGNTPAKIWPVVLYDDDSEDDSDYCYVERSSRLYKEPKIYNEKNHELIIHARGLHFYQDCYDIDARANYRRYSQTNLLTSIGIYSADTHKRAEIKFPLPEYGDSPHNTNQALKERENILVYHAKTTREQLQNLNKTGRVTPVLQRGSRSSRKEYKSRLIELYQRYVNSYKTLTEDIKATQKQDPKSRRTKRTQLKHEILKTLQDNPFVSTSEDIGVGLQYSSGILNYDLKHTHQPRPKLDITLKPEYQSDGRLMHPYLGVIFVTLHTQSELDENSVSVVDLFSRFEVDINKGPGTHRSSGYIRALERIFLGSVSNKNVYLAEMFRLPNMYYPYRAFIEKKYGLTKKEYEKFQADLNKYGKVNPSTGRIKNEKAFLRTQQLIIQSIIKSAKIKIISHVKSWAEKYNIDVGCLDINNHFTQDYDLDQKLDDAVNIYEQNRKRSIS